MSTTYSFNFKTGKLEPIAAAGLIPLGAVVTYEDMKNPRRRFVVTGADLGAYGHGQACVCEDGHRSTVSQAAINDPGGWQDTGERLTPEQVKEFLAAAAERGERERLAAEATATARTADHAKQRAAAIAAHPALERVPAGGYPTAKLAAANIRRQLKAAFPGTKFSVRSDTFSGGDSVDIHWTLGPTTQEVEAITNNYQEGHFNGMEDIYEDNSENIWPGLFGGAKFVMCHREIGGAEQAILPALAIRLQATPPTDGKSWWNVYPGDTLQGSSLLAIAGVIIRSQSYPPGAVITGLELCPDEREADGMARYYRATYTAPAQSAPDPETEATGAQNAAGVTVRYNKEKNGVELSFPSKPDAGTLARVKSAGFRWSKFSRVWYARRSSATVSAAARIAGLTDAESAATFASTAAPDAFDMATEDRMAEMCGA